MEQDLTRIGNASLIGKIMQTGHAASLIHNGMVHASSGFSYVSIFVTESTCKANSISRIVPMVPHIDHSEHDVDILVTETRPARSAGAGTTAKRRRDPPKLCSSRLP